MLAIFSLNSTITPGGTIGLLIELGILFLDFWAVSRIIGQAGYSRTWILVPLMPLLLTVIAFVIVFHDLTSSIYGGTFGVANIDTIGAIWVLDLFSIVINWIFFLIFAFSTWPVTKQNYARFNRAAPPTAGGGPIRSNTPPPNPPAPSYGVPNSRPAPPPPIAPSSEMPSSRPAPPPPSATNVAPGQGGRPLQGPINQTPVVALTVQYCQWCGKEQAVNALAIHHCGPKTRPAAFCTKCGTPLLPGSSSCANCDVAKFCTKCGTPLAPGSSSCANCDVASQETQEPPK